MLISDNLAPSAGARRAKPGVKMHQHLLASRPAGGLAAVAAATRVSPALGAFALVAAVSGMSWAPSAACAQLQTPSQDVAASSPDTAFADETSAAGSLALSRDAASRMTVPVLVNGQGPFDFVVDTGSDRTVISRELATRLGLPKGPDVMLHGSAGVEQVETALIERLTIGNRVAPSIDAPVLAAANLGADGMLGIDSLRNQHVVLDFRNRTLSATQSTPVDPAPFTIVVRGRSRFGQLILVDAEVRGRKVYVIVDSGAQNTIGNLALQRLLATKATAPAEQTLADEISVTGLRSTAELQDVAEMHVGALTIRNMRLAFADLHTFDRYGLANKPAMLLGMDVLRMCDRVTVDFDRREATFTLR